MKPPADLEPLDGELADLLGAERRRPPAPADVRARVRGRVMTTVGPGGGGSPPPGRGPPPATPAGLLVKPLLLGAALGSVVGVFIVTRPEPADAPRPAVTASFQAVVPSSRPAGTDVPAVTAPLAAVPAPVATAHPGAVASREESLAAERRVLDEAQRALADGRSAAAFEALAEHARMFPRGRLAEEREGLWIRALARAGRMDEARDRATRFRAIYPHSILLPAIDETLGTIP
jgi:hypothetical protein